MLSRISPVVDPTAGELGPARSAGTSIVIVTYNSETTIANCLHSVLLSIEAGDEVIVVDNASIDGTRREIQQFLPLTSRLRLIESKANLGFSTGCNTGLRASQGTYLVLLNPDTIVYPRWLEKLRRVFAEDVGAVGPVSDNAALHQGIGCYVEPGRRLQELQDVLTEGYAGQVGETKLLVGFCLMVKRDILNRVGLLDEDLFVGNDDLELSWRLRTHGLRLLIALDVFVHHTNHVSFTSVEPDVRRRYIEESWAALTRKLRRHYPVLPSNSELWGLEEG